MASFVKHHASEGVLLAPVALASVVPPTQHSVQYGGNYLYDQYQMNEVASAVTAGQYMSFTCNPSFDAMTDVGESFIKIVGYYTLAALKGIPTDGAAVTTPMFLAAAFANDVTFTLNGNPITPSQGFVQPYVNAVWTALNMSYTDRMCGQVTEGYILDLPYMNNMAEVQNVATADSQQLLRQKAYMSATAGNSGQRPFSLTLRLKNYGLTVDGGAWLPPNTAMQIRMRRAPDEAMRQGPSAQISATSPVFTLNSATCYLARKVLTPAARMSLDAAWRETTLKVPFQRARTSTTWFSATDTNINIPNALAGPTPRTVVAIMVPQKSINCNGDGTEALMQMSGFAFNTSLSDVSLTFGGGRGWPVQPLSTEPAVSFVAGWAGGSFDMSQMYQMYRAAANENPFLTDLDFGNVAMLVFPIGTQKDAWDTSAEVSCSFRATLKYQPGYDYAVILMSFSDTIIEFTKEGQVQVL